MNQRTLEWGMIAIACLFTVVFASVVIPPLLRDGDVFGAFAAGFVNPYSSGYATDALLCWLVLAVWVVHDRVMFSVRYGWLCLLLGIVPGVAVGLPLYIVIRSRQLTQANIH